MSFIRKLLRFRNQQKDIGELTDFLAGNEAFKQAAKSLHTSTQQAKGGFGFFAKIDQYLEKELLPKDYDKQP
jgi:hypothetical protein